MVDTSPVTETGKAWFIDIILNSQTVNFKVDTGAAVTAVPSTMSNIFPELLPTNKSLRGAGNYKLNIAGKANAKLGLEEKVIQETVYIVDGLVTPLLGKPAIAKLELIQFLHEVHGKSYWVEQFPGVFKGLGALDNEVKIQLKEEVTPFAQSVPRRVAAARKPLLKQELDRMERLGVIERVERPTDWCAPCIVVPKKNGSIRVCIDFTRLNEAVRRELHPLPKTEETLSELGTAKRFSKLDANSGYWQMKLEKESQELTTFITPFGRYMCKRLPFGISSAPEVFQREMQKVLVDTVGVVCQMDDILVYGETQEEHDIRLKTVMDRISKAGMTLNIDKCQFNVPEVVFLGHIISSKGIKADPDKTNAITNFKTPTNRKELRRFFGIMNYLGKFSPTLAQDTHHLRLLLQKDYEWCWGSEQANEFSRLKEMMIKTPTLATFRLEAPTLLSTDASSFGLGAAVLQEIEGVWRPIAYASRTLSTAEVKYAQIEKEALAICWACDKFHYYLAGREFTVETDHKPLVSILGTKELAKLPLRVQRFRLRMMNYSYKIRYTPGAKLVLADALSRSPVGEQDKTGHEKVDVILNELVETLAVSTNRLNRIKAAILEDPVGSMLLKYISEGWPSFKKVNSLVKNFYTFKEMLTSVQGVVFYEGRMFVPELERDSVLRSIHSGHQGETKCIRRATELVWWPGMTTRIRELVKNCEQCREFRRVPREPLMCTEFPERPWWRLAIDLMEKQGTTYLVVVDYFSRFITVHPLIESTTSECVVKVLQELFCMIGIPNSVMSDNGPQFTSEVFKRFLQKWDIQHITSSPRYPQSNGEVERAVQTVKGLMDKNINLAAAMCAYRDTPLANGYSPANLLFGRSMNSMGILNEKRIDLERLRKSEKRQRETQADYYDKRHRVRERSPLQLGQRVVVDDPGKQPVPAEIVATRGREVVAVGESARLMRRNRNSVRVRAGESIRTDRMEARTILGNTNPETTPPEHGEWSKTVREVPESVREVPDNREPEVTESRTDNDERVENSKTSRVSKTCRSEAVASAQNVPAEVAVTGEKRTRSGRCVKPVQRLNL